MLLNKGLKRILAALLFSAAVAAPSAWAQSNEEPAGASATSTAVVELPALIVDLFRSTPPGAPAAGDAAAAQAGPGFPPPFQGPLPVPIAVSGDFVPDEVVVNFAGDAALAQQVASGLGLQVRSLRTSFLLGTSVVRFGIPDGRSVGTVLAQLRQDGRIANAGANHIYTLQQADLPGGFAFEKIAFDTSQANGANVRIAVIDTARDKTHPALANIVAEDFDAMPDIPVQDTKHGTSIVGLIAGQDAFAGLAPGAEILHARAFENGKSNVDAILAALDWSAEQNAQIINMSFEGPRNQLMELACAAAFQRGILLVAAAGNHGPKAPFAYPAAFRNVVAVTATDEQNKRMQQANIGPYLRISAPGVGVMAPISGGGFDLVTGTSFAAAIYTGAIASLMHRAPQKGVFELEQDVVNTARDLGAKGRDVEFGFGLVDVKAALASGAQ